MGRGSSTGNVSDYYKKKGQAKHGEGSKRRKLTRKAAEKRRKAREEIKSGGNPATG